MKESLDGIQVEEKWLRFGLLLGALNVVFLLVLVYLLRVNPTVALAFAVAGGFLGGVAVMIIATRLS